jgi:hypothetical protein
MRKIGVLMGWPENDPEAQSERAAFVHELQKLGWVDGRNLQIDTRWAAPADPESMHRLAKELVALQPDLLLSQSTPATTALLQETRTIPVIFGIVADPIGSGFVASFNRPGGNATGFRRCGTGAGWQVAGTAQGDCAAGDPSRRFVQSRNGDICRILAEALQSRRSVLCGGGDSCTCPRYL